MGVSTLAEMDDVGIYLREVERQLGDALADATDQKGENLLRREGGGVPLIPEASRVIAQLIAIGLLRDLTKVLTDVRSAYTPAPGAPVPDWSRLYHAVAYSALRLAGEAVHTSFREARKASGVEGA
jgi:hypothetical protein